MPMPSEAARAAYLEYRHTCKQSLVSCELEIRVGGDHKAAIEQHRLAVYLAWRQYIDTVPKWARY